MRIVPKTTKIYQKGTLSYICNAFLVYKTPHSIYKISYKTKIKYKKYLLHKVQYLIVLFYYQITYESIEK